MKTIFMVADHRFALSMDDGVSLASSLAQYEPFRVSPDEIDNNDNFIFELKVVSPENFPADTDYVEELSQDDDGSQISAGHVGDRPFFKFLLRDKLSACLITTSDYKNGIVTIERNELFGLNNALMVMFAMATADKQTALFHSSVVSYQNKAYMFLGHSGTGKSTHSSLWLKHIEGTELMNDDNPVVRVIDGQARVYGSPWSGKTPCYRNVEAPLGAIVELSQAPFNRIRRLGALEAYVAIFSSVSGKRWDKRQAEGLFQTENMLVSLGRVFHLECLPDEAAARLCMETVTRQD